MSKLRKCKSIFIYLLIGNLVFYCSNPIEKKKKELQNCIVTVAELEITNFRMFIVPPVPKIYFKTGIRIENTNDVPVTIDRFAFKIALLGVKSESKDAKETEQEPSYIAEVINEKPYTIPPLTTEIIYVNMQTIFEENPDRRVIKFFSEILRGVVTGKELEFLLDGTIEFDTVLGAMNIPVKEKIKTKLKF